MKNIISTTTLRYLALSAVIAGLVSVSAWLPIPLPFTPVPITLQTLFVLMAGLLLPPIWALASMGLYLFVGIIGLPVFAGGGRGFATIMGPTGGFLIGFVIAAFIVSLFRTSFYKQPFPIVGDALAVIIGTIIIYACGYPWIVIVLEWEWRVGLVKAVLPYLPGDILKIIVASILAKPARIIILRNA